MVHAMIPGEKTCSICGCLLGPEPHITDHPDGEHTACVDWTARP